MNLPESQARARLAQARVARLATADATGRPHVIPVTFALETAGRDGTGSRAGSTGHADAIYIAIDHKPKTTTNLKRLRNIEENPRVSLLADHYADDWSMLWWARVDGVASVRAAGPAMDGALDLLAAKYPQYQEHRPDGPLIVIEAVRWVGWASS